VGLSKERKLLYYFYRNQEDSMPHAQRRSGSPRTDAVVLTKAVTRAAQKLDIKNKTLASILGVSEPTVSRMNKGEFVLDKSKAKNFELGILFVRLFRSLDATVSGDEAVARAWLNNHNLALREAPINLIQNIGGLVNVIQYLDARRARI
jgi:hypothetical protein